MHLLGTTAPFQSNALTAPSIKTRQLKSRLLTSASTSLNAWYMLCINVQDANRLSRCYSLVHILYFVCDYRAHKTFESLGFQSGQMRECSGHCWYTIVYQQLRLSMSCTLNLCFFRLYPFTANVTMGCASIWLDAHRAIRTH